MTTLEAFNAAPDDKARPLLNACLDIDSWVDDLLEHRPYSTVEKLHTRATEASAGITWDQVATALARHPRIGESARTEQDQAMSAREQAGVLEAQAGDFAAANAAYEREFGHIFLICASGLTGDQMLAALRQRMTNDPETEHLVVISELRKIASLRLESAVTADA